VLKSNIAACHLRLEEWAAAVAAATRALEALDRALPAGAAVAAAGTPACVEIAAEGDAVAAAACGSAAVEAGDRRRADVARIKAKALLRRAKGRVEIGGWAELAAAEEGGCLFIFVGSWLTIEQIIRC
jgi:hypothetical protein